MEENPLAEVEEARDEMLENASLTDILNKKVKYAEREVITYLDYDAALEALELQEVVVELDAAIEQAEKSNAARSITDDPVGELTKERDEAVAKLAELNETLQAARVVWTVRGIAPKVWKVIDKTARRKYPLAKDADDHTKIEVQLDRNEYVIVETIRQGLVKVEFANGHTITEFSHEDAATLWDEMPQEAARAVKDMIDKLSFANRAFTEEIESADFLSNN